MKLHTIFLAILPALALAMEADGKEGDFEGGNLPVPGPSSISFSTGTPSGSPSASHGGSGSSAEHTGIKTNEGGVGVATFSSGVASGAATGTGTGAGTGVGAGNPAPTGLPGGLNGTANGGVVANENQPNNSSTTASGSGALPTGVTHALGLLVAGVGVAALF